MLDFFTIAFLIFCFGYTLIVEPLIKLYYKHPHECPRCKKTAILLRDYDDLCEECAHADFEQFKKYMLNKLEKRRNERG